MPHHVPTLRPDRKLPQGRRGLTLSAKTTQRITKEIPIAAGRSYALGGSLGRVYVEHRLGAGAQGVVWAARGTLWPGPLALKVVDLRHTDRTALAYAVALQRRCRSPHVVAAYAAHLGAQNAYILTERIAGQDLETYLCLKAGRANTAAMNHLLTLFSGMVQGVLACHVQGVIHRDIKPENFLVTLPATSQPTVKLADFDLATQRATGQSVGTVTYLAPEALLGTPVGLPADVWSLGISLFRMVVGIEPFYDDDEHHTARAIIKNTPSTTFADLALCLAMFQIPDKMADEVACLVAACLSPDPKKRPTCAALLEHLNAIR